MTEREEKSGPGFQGSESSRCEVFVYPHGDDAVLVNPPTGELELRGRGAGDKDLSLVSASTTKVLGGGAGTFSLTVRAPLNHPFVLDRALTDDDWVDVVFSRHERRFHVMRGLIDSILPETRVENGVTVREWQVTGRDFQKCFEETRVWFNRYVGENATGGAALQALASNQGFFGNVSKTVQAFLFGFLDQLNGKGRSLWEIPGGVPGIFGGQKLGGAFVVNAIFPDDSGYSKMPARAAFNAAQIAPNGESLWDIAQEWSDPQFCELWCDLYNDSDQALQPGEELDPSFSVMAIIIRDRPFPTSAFGPASASPWFSLPLAIVNRQEIESAPMRLSGEERMNAFTVRPIIQAAYANQTVDLSAPLWNLESIRRHGFREHEVTSRYCADDAVNSILSMTQTQRAQVRDWMCLNAYLRSGQMELGHGRPDLRVGMRVRVPGPSKDLDETYYCESVSHSWAYNAGTRTSLGLTRGWIGTDSSYLAALDREAGQYSLASAAIAGAELTPISEGVG
jgi:hypothetical protein